MSLPSWERGLKSLKIILLPLLNLSLPSWERGLKLEQAADKIAKATVAPLVGAWIEISFFWTLSSLLHVAPLVGAWIEIREKHSGG